MGIACQRVGEFMSEPGRHEIEVTFNDLSNLFLESANVCDKLREVSLDQDSRGLGCGYTSQDSAMLANFKVVFMGFAASAGIISDMSFTMSHGSRAETWAEVSECLRGAAQGALRQRELLSHTCM